MVEVTLLMATTFSSSSPTITICSSLRRPSYNDKPSTSRVQKSRAFQQHPLFHFFSPSNPLVELRSTSNDRRGVRLQRVVVPRAGLTTTNLIFAFVFPLSLILVTVFTSARIADKLDEDYVEELAKNQAIVEENDEDETSPIVIEEKPAVQTKRNRPKRAA